MKSDRLVVLIAPEEKARLVALAEARQSSVAELVREALSDWAEDARGLRLDAEQAAALERLADIALRSVQKANTALDRAFEEVETTKAYFAAKRAAAGTGA